MWDDDLIDDVIDKKNIEEVEDLDSILEDEFVPKKRTRRKKADMIANEEYVNKNEMWTELYNYYISLGDNYDWTAQEYTGRNCFPTISNKLTTIVHDIATKMGHRANFCGYSWLEEMKGDAILKMIKAIRDCSFKCYTTVEVLERDSNKNSISFLDKKGKAQTRVIEEDDKFFERNSLPHATFKANPFGYFSRITSHCFLNRIKKEKELEETKRAFQEETWERFYSNENFRNVRRQKHIESDENDATFED